MVRLEDILRFCRLQRYSANDGIKCNKGRVGEKIRQLVRNHERRNGKISCIFVIEEENFLPDVASSIYLFYCLLPS